MYRLAIFLLIVAKQVLATSIILYSSTSSSNLAEREKFAQHLKNMNTTSNTNVTKPLPAIFGGENAGINEFPWFGRTSTLFSTGVTSSCGATLIHTDIAISAAHCVINYFVNNPGVEYLMDFYLGAKRYDGIDGTEISVDYAIYLDEYNVNDYTKNDIVLYKLKQATLVTPLPWNPSPSLPAVGDVIKAIGFGLTESGAASSTLRKVDLPTVSNQACLAFYGSIVDSVLCAGGVRGKDTCGGDSGGPIFSNGLLYGLTSYGKNACGTAPGVYTRISSHTNFIQKTICDFSAFPPASFKPTIAPVKAPMVAPVNAPMKVPVNAPMIAPVNAPMKVPVKAPTVSPIKIPTSAPMKNNVPTSQVVSTAPILPPVPDNDDDNEISAFCQSFLLGWLCSVSQWFSQIWQNLFGVW